jgi:hypothetical protein
LQYGTDAYCENEHGKGWVWSEEKNACEEHSGTAAAFNILIRLSLYFKSY